MAIRLALFEPAYQRIGDKLKALNLDIEVFCFTDGGQIRHRGKTYAAKDTSVDYLWLSPDIIDARAQNMAFDVVRALKSVHLVQTFNAGLDNPFYKEISQKGITICNSSAQAVAISEYVLAQILNHFQPLAAQRQLQAEKQWKVTPFREISRTEWLIAGFGPIGREVAIRAKAFGARINVVRQTPAPTDLADNVGTLKDLHRFASNADIVVLASALNEATRLCVNATFFAALKKDALLINVARGGLIDDDALMSALSTGHVKQAILDVFHQEPLPSDNPLWSHPNITVTSHTSFAGSGVRRRWDDLFFANIVCYAKGETLINQVDPKIFH